MNRATNPARRSAMIRRPLIAVAGLALAGLLSGCVSLGPKVPEQLFRLTPDQSTPAGAIASGRLSDAIVVLDPEADRSLDVLRVPVRVDAARLAYLKDAAWIEKPTRQFRSLLAETIRTRTDRLVVEGGDFEVTGRTRVSGRLLQMGYDAQSRAVVVRFDAAVSNGPGGTAITTRRFEARVPGVAPDAKSVGPALNSAANDVARQVADWVQQAAE